MQWIETLALKTQAKPQNNQRHRGHHPNRPDATTATEATNGNSAARQCNTHYHKDTVPIQFALRHSSYSIRPTGPRLLQPHPCAVCAPEGTQHPNCPTHNLTWRARRHRQRMHLGDGAQSTECEILSAHTWLRMQHTGNTHI